MQITGTFRDLATTKNDGKGKTGPLLQFKIEIKTVFHFLNHMLIMLQNQLNGILSR